MRLCKLAMVLGVGLLLVGAAAAQQPQRPQRQPGGGGFGGGGFGGGGLTFLIRSSKPLQDELKIDQDQLTKVTAALDKVREETREESAKLFGRDVTAEQRAEISKKIADANTKALEGVLKPEQLKRYRQIENQQAGMSIYTKEDVQKTLKLSDDQKEKISTITTDLQKDLRDLAGGAPGGGRGRPDPDAQKKRESLQNEAKENIAKLLNAEQKEALKDVTGEPFDLPRTGGFGGGGPGGGGFGGFGGGGSTPGTVLSNGAQNQLRLTDEQKKELEALQKEVDSKLEKLLTEEQRTQLKTMRENAGRGGFGGGAGGTGGRPGGGGNRPPRPNNPPQ